MRTFPALRSPLLLAALALLAACGGATDAPLAAPTVAPAVTGPAVPAPTAMAAATEAPAAASPPELPAATATVAPDDAGGPLAGIPQGRTPEGYHVLGAADAPVALVMYSDFL